MYNYYAKRGDNMPAKKFFDKTIAFTFRYDAEEWQKFIATATLNGEKPTKVFDKAIQDYMAKNRDNAAKKLGESP